MDLDIPGGDDEMLQFAELNVPDIASKDPEERKCARRIRIKRRLEAKEKQQMLAMEAVEEKQPEKPTLLQIQLEKSSEILKQLFLEVEQQVTNVRVANDAREVDSREGEAIIREQVMAQLEEEANLAIEMFDLIATKWANIMNYNDPLNIHDEIKFQQDKCNELIKQKDTTITMLRNEVKRAEHKFYKDQKMQNDEVSTLAKRVEKQVAIMRVAHSNELQDILDVMIQERSNIMENNNKRWEELYKKREEQELAISENKFRQKDEFEEVVTIVRIKHYERVRGVKIRLERNCEILQQEFEAIKAIAMANQEKMDYNYQILKKREDENIIIKSEQKRKLNKLQDVINHQRDKIDNYEINSKNEMDKLFNEIFKLQKCIQGVKVKSEGMSSSNEKKYMSVWELNRKMASKILNKLLTIDKLLHEQQLGLKWEEPYTQPKKMQDLVSYVNATNMMRAVKGSIAPKPSNMSMHLSNPDLENTLAYKRTLNNVLDRISDRSNFIIESRLNAILAERVKEEDVMLRVDNLFAALQLSDKADINIMMHYFMPYVKCPICINANRGSDLSVDTYMTDKSVSTFQESLMEQQDEDNNPLLGVKETDDTVDDILADIVTSTRLDEEKPEYIQHTGECLGPNPMLEEQEKKIQTIEYMQYGNIQTASTTCMYNHQLVMDPAHVLKALREFVTNTNSGEEEKSMEVPDIAKKTPTISRLMTSQDVSAYWNSYKNILGSDKIQLWDALYYGMEKYHEILVDRSKVHQKVICLRRQNEELRHLLAKYKIDGTMPPPCAEQREIPIMPKGPGTRKSIEYRVMRNRPR
ncbi:PREDICTED: dynein regulatory complex protein 1 [Nicrophorus vespilloides]|uniref:Dynein regulatory complex protein 1 n=1 Tax=Nicrophorus vespilloides TaxID=110193 RepID=A0ABM1NI54_NICVS|nr:PREDICTED: dynein regulatory complex protein 1 [Nicrophorus vespilloides]